MARDYKREYEKYHSKPEQKRDVLVEIVLAES